MRTDHASCSTVGTANGGGAGHAAAATFRPTIRGD